MLTLVTGNAGKYRQISSLLKGTVSCIQQHIDFVEQQSNDMLGVSRSKAMQAFDLIQGPVLVDDSGIYFSAYPDFPGVFSKYIYQSLGMAGLQKLFVQQPNTKAYFQCVLSYMDTMLQEPIQFIGQVQGDIDFHFLESMHIDTHLPYDAIFRPEGMEVVAQLDMHTFESLHHRSKATLSCKDWLIGTKRSE